MPTLFEKIIAGELPATVLYRDSRVIAFLDIRPAAPVHILIVPNKPIPTSNDIADEDESLIGHMFIVARGLAGQRGRRGCGAAPFPAGPPPPPPSTASPTAVIA
jgi:histidine triad (HIT) family protein